jgi:hypothetical protein
MKVKAIFKHNNQIVAEYAFEVKDGETSPTAIASNAIPDRDSITLFWRGILI